MTIFGYPTIEAEIVSLINQGNADYGANFAVGDLILTLGDFDTLEARQRFSIRDNSGKYFGVISDMGIFKRNFQTLFKGITINLQAASGQNNRAILAALCAQQGLPPFKDSDFAPGLLDMNVDVPDVAVPVNWPFASTSWGWTGSVQFNLSNVKNSLTNIITDGDTEGLDPATLSGVTWQIKDTTLVGLDLPVWNYLDKVIDETDLAGLEYPGDTDLSSVITITSLDGLEYPTDVSLDGLFGSLDGLEYPPAVDLASLTATLAGIDYPAGFVSGKPSAWVLTQGLDFSDYGNAIAAYRVGSEINDNVLVNVIVGKIVTQWPTLNTEANIAKLTMAFARSDVTAISTKRSVYGRTTSVTLKLASHALLTGNAVLKYDIETDE